MTTQYDKYELDGERFKRPKPRIDDLDIQLKRRDLSIIFQRYSPKSVCFALNGWMRRERLPWIKLHVTKSRQTR